MTEVRGGHYNARNGRKEMLNSQCEGDQRARRQEKGGGEGAGGGGLRRRFTNRENRLARQLLDHIRTQTKWTSGVDRPFVLGI